MSARALPNPPEEAPLGYRVGPLAKRLSVSEVTIWRAIKKGTLKSSIKLGVRIIDAESVKALFDAKGE